MFVWLYDSGTCGSGNYIGGEYTDSNGDYSIDFIQPGDVMIQTTSSGSYVPTWWNSSNGSTDCSQADSITITTGGTVDNIDFDFTLTPTTGSISGTVTSNSNPVAGQNMYVYETDCSTSVTSTSTDVNGYYYAMNITPGDYRVRTISGAGTYVEEWYDDSTFCADADNVTVSSNNTTPNIDFDLVPILGTINGTITDG